MVKVVVKMVRMLVVNLAVKVMMVGKVINNFSRQHKAKINAS